jgi:hypothetical protein
MVVQDHVASNVNEGLQVLFYDALEGSSPRFIRENQFAVVASVIDVIVIARNKLDWIFIHDKSV